MSVCRFYQQGKCKYGTNCGFLHVGSSKSNEDHTRVHCQDLKYHPPNSTLTHQQRHTNKNTNIRKFKCGNINIDSYMLNEEKLIKVMRGRSIDVMGLAVARHKGCERGRTLHDGYVLMYSGAETDECLNGVALIVGPRLSPHIEEVRLVNNRLLICIFNIGEKKYHVYQVFAPQKDASQEDKDMFMGSLEMAFQREEKVIIMGNFNASVMTDNSELTEGVGPFNEEDEDMEGEILTDFCFKNNLAIMHGLAKRKGANVSSIDYLIVSDKQMLEKVMVYPSVLLISPHKLIMTNIFTENNRSDQSNELGNERKKRHFFKGCLEVTSPEMQEIFADKNRKYKVYLKEQTVESRLEYKAARDIVSKIKGKARREFLLEKAAKRP